MIEFGSDYHSIINSFFTGYPSLMSYYPKANLMADGRQPLISIIRQEGFKRLWVPEYFCYEVLESVKQHTGVKLVPYEDFPGMMEPVKKLSFKNGDAVLSMNFFGMKDLDSMGEVGVPVIEDHSHDLLSQWALYSRADWCVASLRKSLPIAEGGMVWSPKGKVLMVPERCTQENEALANERWKAMDMKTEYLQGKELDKEVFRNLFMRTEEGLNGLEMSGIDRRSAEVIENLNINKWYRAKKRNWQVLAEHLSGVVDYLTLENDSCTPFSMVIRFKDEEQRELVRKAMIMNAIFPAVLWRVPQKCSVQVRKVSSKLLSVHCDGRYSEDDMVVLSNRIVKIIEEL